MKKTQHILDFEEYDSTKELNASDAELLAEARTATAHAYAPYSNFRVGAAALLKNGIIVRGSNQENASYPVGICAERALLAAVATQHHGVAVSAIAISYNNVGGDSDHPIAPCGMCRQSLAEFESRMNQPIRLILGGMEGKVFVLPEAGALLPLAFDKTELSKKT
ncbi:cytidine deaminase [Flavitalea antarctica]